MKKYFFVAFALFAVIGNVKCDSSDEILEGVKSKYLKKYLSQNKDQIDSGLKKLEEECPGVGEKLKQAVKFLQECSDKVDDSLTICQRVQTHSLNCTRPLLKVIDDCLPPRERGVPSLIANSIISVIGHFCQQTGESIFELVNPCIWKNSEEGEDDHACEEQIRQISRKYGKSSNSLSSPIEICGTLTGLRGCIKAHIGVSCKNQKTKNAINGYIDAVLAPCAQVPQETLSRITSITSNFL